MEILGTPSENGGGGSKQRKSMNHCEAKRARILDTTVTQCVGIINTSLQISHMMLGISYNVFSIRIGSLKIHAHHRNDYE